MHGHPHSNHYKRQRYSNNTRQALGKCLKSAAYVSVHLSDIPAPTCLFVAGLIPHRHERIRPVIAVKTTRGTLEVLTNQNRIRGTVSSDKVLMLAQLV